jgi:hypothetical protein
MPGQRFRLRESTVAVGLDEAFHQIFVNIPSDAEITIVDDDIGRALFVTVNWKGHKLKILAADLEGRGKQVRAESN